MSSTKGHLETVSQQRAGQRWKRDAESGMTAKRHRAWHRQLAEYWKRKGIIEYCEVRFPGCYGTYGLAPAHSKDRNDIHSKEEFFEIVAACEKCHFTLDREMPKDERLAIVKRVIESR